MSAADITDVVLVGMLLSGAVAGSRRGLVATVLGGLAFLLGAAFGLWLLPDHVATLLPGESALLRPATLIAAVIACGAVAWEVVTHVAAVSRRRVGRSSIGWLDKTLGAALSLAVAAVTIWFSAGLVRIVVPGALSAGIARSRVVSAIDGVVPSAGDRVLGGVKTAIDAYGFPRVFDTIGAEPIRPVDDADPSVAHRSAVAAATASVLRVDADVPACRRAQEGTGWVYAAGLVVTNAHVVAGSSSVRITGGQVTRPARVVVFDPNRDLAVLAVDRLAAAPLRVGRDLGRNEAAVVVGYPLGGPLRVDAARVREVVQAQGEDIYGSSSVLREVYSLRTTVQPGNSGGPLLAPDGSVSGVIFARSLEDASTGYALTLAEAKPVLDQARVDAEEVGTGGCTAG